MLMREPQSLGCAWRTGWVGVLAPAVSAASASGRGRGESTSARQLTSLPDPWRLADLCSLPCAPASSL